MPLSPFRCYIALQRNRPHSRSRRISLIMKTLSLPLLGNILGILLTLMLAAVSLAPPAKAQSQPPFNLIPQPANVKPGTGGLPVGANFTIAFTGHTESRLDRAADRFLTPLHRHNVTLLPKPSRDAAQATLVVHTDHASKEIQELGEDESYALEVTATGAKLNAANPLGVLRGLQTFLQLVEVSPNGFAAPAATIQDQPRFDWR